MTPTHLPRLKTSLLAAAIASVSCAPVFATDSDLENFRRIATFPVYENLDLEGGDDLADETVAEIITASEDGLTLIYTDSEKQRLGFIDISNPGNPVAAGFIPLDGEPTSATVKGDYALVGVNTSASFTEPAGELVVIDIESRVVIHTLDMGGQPDSTAISPDGRFAAVVIENERDEDIIVGDVEGGLPQLPAGFLNIIDTVGDPLSWQVRYVDLSGLSALAPSDPEPEFVDIGKHNHAVVTLQENNHIVIVNLQSGKVVQDFPAGTVSLSDIDTEGDKVIDPSGSLDDLPREPDAVTWMREGLFATANEGDLNGGSRGFSVFDRDGNVVFDSGNSFEQLAIRHGHYPEKRAGKKGTEPEGIEYGKFGKTPYLFVGSERGNFVSVYKAQQAGNPTFKQLLPTGVGPEGLLALPGRDLLVVAAEKDDADEGFRATVSIYELQDDAPGYPGITSSEQDLIPWGALSGLSRDKDNDETLYAVHDSFYRQSRFYTVDISSMPAVIYHETVLNKEGNTVNYDLEGIAQAADGSFWLVSEGKPSDDLKNMLVHADATGNVLAEYLLPIAVQDKAKSNGFEGVAVSNDQSTVYVAFQREWQGDPDNQVRIGVFDIAGESWTFFYYPIEAASSGWVGLSEITALEDGRLAVIERDNQQGPAAAIKRIYSFDPATVSPKPEGEVFDLVEKTLANDLLEELNATNGWTPDKVEGLAVIGNQAYVVTDNDGLDDAVGETLFFSTPLEDSE